MKFESMPKAETPAVEVQPVAPDESQRVEDVAKAQEMADAGAYHREEAARLRELEEKGERPKEFGRADSKTLDKMAEEREEGAAVRFEQVKEKGGITE